MKQKLLKLMCLLCVSMMGVSAWAADSWEKATSIKAGDVVLIVVEGTAYKYELNGISSTSTKYGIGASYSTSPAGKYPLTVEAGSSDGTFSFKNGTAYLNWSTGNSLSTADDKSANTSWSVTFSDGNAVIKNAHDNTRQIKWNNSSPRFACYTSGQAAIQLYKKVESSTPTCEAPTFSVAEGAYTTAQSVTLSTTTDGATIYYTTNGDEPTTSSSVYSSAISVSTTTTIKAIAVKDGYVNSGVASASYTIYTPTTFNKVTNKNQLVAGNEYIVVCEESSTAMGAQSGTLRTYEDVTISSSSVIVDPTSVAVLTLGGSTGAWTFLASIIRKTKCS